MTDTANAPERIWTADTTGNCSVGFNTPSLDYKNEYISRTHCDELVAAAYLDAAQRIEQCLWSQHWYIDGESVDPEDLSEGITKRTPDDARAALTAYGERMKAEGALGAQAELIEEPTEPGSFVGDIWFGRQDNRTYGTHRWDGAAWQALPTETEALIGLLAKERVKIARLTEALKAEHAYWVKCADADWAEQDLHERLAEYPIMRKMTEAMRKADALSAALQENANG